MPNNDYNGYSCFESAVYSENAAELYLQQPDHGNDAYCRAGCRNGIALLRSQPCHLKLQTPLFRRQKPYLS